MSDEPLRDEGGPGPAVPASPGGESDRPPMRGPAPGPHPSAGGLDAPTCRGHALECAVMALAAETPREKQLFTRLFQAWTNLAIDLERSAPST
jgi:hypothetical protein